MTSTYTSTYTTADIENVMRKFKADLLMIAESSGGMAVATARDIGADIETFAKDRYIASVDVTLLQYGQEKRAATYTVTDQAGNLTSSRPGGVLWDCLPNAELRVVVSMSAAWWALPDATRQQIDRRMKSSWTSNTADLSHSSLQSQTGRNFTSDAYGLTRKDYSL